MKNLIRKLWRHNEKFSAIIPFAVLAAILLSGQLIRTATADVSRKFYQTSPNPSPTFTPSPVGPTNTPPPPTSTDTPTPTALPPTSTDTPVPPTPTDTPVPNRPPEITKITGPTEPIPVNEEAVVSVSFSDPDIGDSHEACFNWEAGPQNCYPSITGTDALTDTHPYAVPGIFSVVVTINEATGSGWAATTAHLAMGTEQCGIYHGTADPSNGTPATVLGVVNCSF